MSPRRRASRTSRPSRAAARRPVLRKAGRGVLETFPNPEPGRPYEILHLHEEFTSLCPLTGHPDFATISVRYVPGATCVELKSLKLYLHGYRDRGVFYEALVNCILDDLKAAMAPQRIEVSGEFRGRGGIRSRITVAWPRAPWGGSGT
ncbi:MAG: preQ(1) synthase [Planctomycetia bacterium]